MHITVHLYLHNHLIINSKNLDLDFYIYFRASILLKLNLMCFTTERITLKNTKKPKSQSQYLNHYLIILSKNLDLDFYIYFAVPIKVVS